MPSKNTRAANRGVARNKKPLSNILYWIEGDPPNFVLYWAYEKEYNHRSHGGTRCFHGAVTEDEIKARLTPNQWCKFKQGERYFVRQRRVDGRNIPVKKTRTV